MSKGYIPGTQIIKLLNPGDILSDRISVLYPDISSNFAGFFKSVTIIRCQGNFCNRGVLFNIFVYRI